MKTYLIVAFLFLANSSFSQTTKEDEVRNVNGAMAAYFTRIAEISETLPFRNAANGWFRQYIAEDGALDDGNEDPKAHPPAGIVTSLAHPTLLVGSNEAMQLLNVFKIFADLNQSAFIRNRNHRPKGGLARAIIHSLDQVYISVIRLGSDIVYIYVTGGTDVLGWVDAAANFERIYRNMAAEIDDDKNAANGWISEDVNNAASYALKILNNCNFTDHTLENSTKNILSTVFTSINKLTDEYRGQHINWLNPGWQIEYGSIMKAASIAILNLNNCKNFAVSSKDDPIALTPESYRGTLVTEYVMSRIKKGKPTGDFIYYSDTTAISSPKDYQLSFTPMANAPLCNSDQTMHITLSNIKADAVNPTRILSATREIRMTVNRRTYRKMKKISKRNGLKKPINKNEKDSRTGT